MKGNDKAAWRPRRFDVAGAHPDEAWRAVANISEAVGGDPQTVHRHAGNRGREHDALAMEAEQAFALRQRADAEVQRFLAKGVEIMDAREDAVRFERRQRQVRNRCNELAKSMEKVLARRPDEQPRQRFSRSPRMRM